MENILNVGQIYSQFTSLASNKKEKFYKCRQGMLTEGEGSVHLTSSLRQVVFKTGKLFAVVIEGNGKRQKERG